ncbi:hypothetical protein LTR50_001899 [Elasticomyces elasticus]|nr:hypothetical protein LTR50_001899 [Elasticomyces elasticus]
MTASGLALNQTIELNDCRIATIRFLGTTSFAPGEWVGVELEDSTGKNDGSVKGQRYFNCAEGHGIFLRAAGISKILSEEHDQGQEDEGKDEQAEFAPGLAANINGNGTVAGIKPSSLHADVAALRRQSSAESAGRGETYAASSTPEPKSVIPPRRARSPTMSPTKQLGSAGPASNTTSRTNTPPGTNRRPSVTVSVKPRPSMEPSSTTRASRSSMAPPALPLTTSAASRLSKASAGGAGRLVGNASLTARAPVSRPSFAPRAGLSKRLSTVSGEDASDQGSRRSSVLSASEQSRSPVLSPKLDDETPTSSVVSRVQVSAPQILPRTPMPRRPSSPPASIVSQNNTHTARTTASAREMEDMHTKLRLLERKRLEDREKLKGLDRIQQERDRFESIIQKLQTKYKPHQQEIADLKRQLKESESRLVEIEAVQVEHDSVMEMSTLDREMAEETAEVLRTELEALRQKSEELELEIEVLREENQELGAEMSPEERTSQGWLQMERSNERLREALLRLRDVTQEQEAEFKSQIKGLEREVQGLGAVKEELESSRERLMQSEADIDNLRQQLEVALGAEDMIEELTERNMSMQEKMDELRATVEDLESLKELNDELEINHVETEKQMQDEIDFKDAVINEQVRRSAQQDESIEDCEYTIARFRQLVINLQSDLEDMRASQQITETEVGELSSKSRAMIDLNMKLQVSAAKTQTKTIDLEMRKLEAQEASEHLAIVQLFLPEAFNAERDSVLALLRFKRIGFKAHLIHGFIRERVAGAGSRGSEEDIFAACDVLDKLTWISAMCDRFVASICSCSVEHFARYGAALYELEPVERALNSYVEGLKREELKERHVAEELQRSMALMTHLASIHIQEDVSTYADDILMRTVVMQNRLETTASALGLTRNLVQLKVPALTSDSEDAQELVSFVQRVDNLISQVRSAKVVMAKAHRALAELKTRSLSLDHSALPSFAQCDADTAELVEYTRSAGEALLVLFGEEGRNDPYALSEICDSVNRTTTQFFSLQTPEISTFATFTTRLKTITDAIVGLGALATDLSNTIEFDRPTAPWVRRSKELKATKVTSIDAEAEVERLGEAVKESRVTLREKERELEEHGVRIEMLEARMRDASKRSAKIAELETLVALGKSKEKEILEALEKYMRQVESLEREKDEWKRVMEDGAGKSNAAGGREGEERMVASQWEIGRARYEVKSLQGAVRYLREENHRLRVPPAASSSIAWLEQPLTKKRSPMQQQRTLVESESKDVLSQLLHLATQEAQTVDLTTLPANKLQWRPARETSRWQVQRRREAWEQWRDWNDEVVSKSRRKKADAAVGRAVPSYVLPFFEGGKSSTDAEASEHALELIGVAS